MFFFCFVSFVQDFSGDTFLLAGSNSVLKTDTFLLWFIFWEKLQMKDVRIYVFLSEKQVLVPV